MSINVAPSGRPPLRYWLDRNDVIERVSRGWARFARENGAPHLTAESVGGRPLWDFVSGAETVTLYRALFQRVRERSQRVSVPFRCDGPSVRRDMRLTLLPAGGGSIECVAELVDAIPRPEVRLLDAAVPRSGALLLACGWCKRVQVEGDWVEPEIAVERLGLFRSEVVPPISHGICSECDRRLLGFQTV